MIGDFTKSAFKHTAIFSLGDLLNRLIGFVLLPIYLHYLSPADYGLLELLGVVMTLIGMVTLQGIPTAAFKGLNHVYLDDPDAQKEVIGTSYLYLFFSSLALFGICFMFSQSISNMLFSKGDYIRLVQIVLLTSFFQTLNMIPYVIFRARLQSVRAITVSFIMFIINAGFKIYFVVFLNKGVEGVLLGGLIAAILLFIATPFLIWKETRWRMSIQKLRPMLAYGWPLIPGAIAAWILSAADRYCLEHFSNRTELGLYALGFRMSVFIEFLFTGPFQKTWPALFFPIVDRPDAPHILGRFSTYFWCVGICMCLFIIYVSEPIIMVIGTKEYDRAYLIVPFISAALLLNGFQQVMNVGLFVKSKTQYAPIILISGAVLNVGLNIAMIPSLGMYGAGIATLVSSFFMVVITHFLNKRFYSIQYEFNRIFHLSALFALFVVLNLIIPYNNLSSVLPSDFIYKEPILILTMKAALFLLFLLSMFVTGLFNKQELYELRRVFYFVPIIGKILK